MTGKMPVATENLPLSGFIGPVDSPRAPARICGRICENEYEAQVKALEWMMKPSAILAAKLLGIGTQRKGCHILDVGAGSAVWSLTMLQEDAAARVEAIDWPAVLKIAKAGADAVGLSNRFITTAGNFLEIEMTEANYDLIVIANVTHILTVEKNIALFKKVKKSLKKDGEIVIFDVFSGQEKGNLAAALYALGLGIRTEEGSVFKPDELVEFLKMAGCNEFKITPLEVPPYTMGMLEAK
jgi:2-polyprenyl-3-methyl-5-hydroxy-6-metoxy-1,4-benzoquinol methylase